MTEYQIKRTHNRGWMHRYMVEKRITGGTAVPYWYRIGPAITLWGAERLARCHAKRVARELADQTPVKTLEL